MTDSQDDHWGMTRSGYSYQRIRAADLLPLNDDEPFSFTCMERRCGTVIQGGESALEEHRRTVHPEIYGDGGLGS